MFTLTKVAALACFFAIGTNALGINCEGSGECGSGGGDAVSTVISLLQDQVNAGNGENFFYNEDQIVCTGNICAFMQNGQNTNVNRALQLAQQIQGHGCKNCGSVPTDDGNDVGNGELTINYVNTDCCDDGDCYCSQYALSSTPSGESCDGCF